MPTKVHQGCSLRIQVDQYDVSTKLTAPSSPSGSSAQKSRTVTPPLATTPPVAILSDSPTPLPENLRSKSKRKFQSRIDDLFLPLSSSPGGTKDCPLRLDDGSDSEELDDIQLETEKPSEPPISPDSDSDSDDIVGPRVRRQRYLPSSPALGRSQTPPLRTHDSEDESSQDQDSEDELSQELRDITSSAQKVRVDRRTRGNESRNKRKSQFQKNLESLKRRKSTTQEESSEESIKARALYDSESDVDSVDSDHFVVEDEEDVTAEQLMEIPPEFTSVSYQGTQHNFKVVIQAEVYAILHPEYEFLDYSSKFFIFIFKCRQRTSN
jgi:hypothetical protein